MMDDVTNRWLSYAGVHPGDQRAAARIGRAIAVLPGRWRWTIERFLLWWLDELSAIRQLLARFAQPPAMRPQSGPCRLVVDPDLLLAMHVDIPTGALPMAEDLIAIEVQAQTPFALDELLIAYRLEPAVACVRARVHLVPLHSLAGSIDPDSIDAIELTEGGVTLEVDPSRANRPPSPWDRTRLRQRVRLAALAGGCIIMLGATLWIPVIVQRAQLGRETAAFAAERAALQPALAAFAAVQAQQAQNVAAIAAKAERPMMIDVLHRLTHQLDEAVYLTTLRWEDGILTVSGLAPDAAALISILERDPTLRNVRLAAPVSFESASQRQRFELAMELEQDRTR